MQVSQEKRIAFCNVVFFEESDTNAKIESSEAFEAPQLKMAQN